MKGINDSNITEQEVKASEGGKGQSSSPKRGTNKEDLARKSLLKKN